MSDLDEFFDIVGTAVATVTTDHKETFECKRKNCPIMPRSAEFTLSTLRSAYCNLCKRSWEKGIGWDV